jgi:hypothetical protein
MESTTITASTQIPCITLAADWPLSVRNDP